MKTNVVVSSVFCLAACSLLPGCASIVSGRYADVAIDSCPTNAHVVVHDDDGREVASLNTPGVVSLKRSRGIVLPARYTAVIAAPGYETAQVPINSTMNPWIIGNIPLIYTIVPGLIVDSATGAVWQPRESQIFRQLAPVGGPDQGMMYSATPPAPQSSAEPPQYVADRSAQAKSSTSSVQDAPQPTSTH